MSNSVLVTYASSYGSTREVAEAVAETLRACGFTVDSLPVKQVRDIDRYNGIVLGAPLYMFHWHKQATGFLARNRQALSNHPAAVFALGPITPGNEAKEFPEARAMLDKELAKFPWFHPITVEMFGGKIDPTHLRFPFSMFMKEVPAADLRDWDAIRRWAADLPPQMITTH
ncbi:MAG: flavodoxin domain-containing protein [Chloroflexi bacterium]|nr:flavodoxin domain-containing protein [Chloroflexota bacterium]